MQKIRTDICTYRQRDNYKYFYIDLAKFVAQLENRNIIFNSLIVVGEIKLGQHNNKGDIEIERQKERAKEREKGGRGGSKGNRTIIFG